MPLWNQTGNQLAERKNAFLKDLAHGLAVTYTVIEMSGGSFDTLTDRVVSGTPVEKATNYGKAALLMPIKALDQGEGSGTRNPGSKLVVTAGHRIEGVDIEQTISVRMHKKVPLNFTATYTINGQIYKLATILNSVAIGATAFWNDVLLKRA